MFIVMIKEECMDFRIDVEMQNDLISDIKDSHEME